METRTQQTVLVIGYSSTDGIGRTVGKQTGPASRVTLSVDMTHPITLERCRQIIAKADEMVGIAHKAIKVTHQTWDGPADIDWDENPEAVNLLRTTDYCYDLAKNSMIIWDNHRPIYANDDGRICRDLDALADTLM